MDITFNSIEELREYLKDLPEDVSVKLSIETDGGETDDKEEKGNTSDQP